MSLLTTAALLKKGAVYCWSSKMMSQSVALMWVSERYVVEYCWGMKEVRHDFKTYKEAMKCVNEYRRKMGIL